MKRIAVVVLIVLALVLFAVAREREEQHSDILANVGVSATTTAVTLGGTVVSAEVADTLALRAKGLSGRESLGREAGMLFVFDVDDRHGFWMKDMRFPIDIIWLNASGTVVHLVSRAQPESYPTIFTPSAPARYVLEVNAGFAEEYDVRDGDRAIVVL
jgi:hypothetical protein